MIRHALNVWATARDRGGLTARGMGEVAEALDAVGQVVELLAAEGRVAANAGDLAIAGEAARRASASAGRCGSSQAVGSPPGTAPVHAPAQQPHPHRAAPAPSPQRDGSPADPPIRVLVVDDDAAHRDTLVRLLQLCGHAAAAAADGQAALDGLRAGDAPPPDLVLLDMMMPGLTGADVLRAMRADPRLRRVPVVVYSAAHTPESERAALALGARAYLVKARAGLDEIRSAIARYARAA